MLALGFQFLEPILHHQQVPDLHIYRKRHICFKSHLSKYILLLTYCIINWLNISDLKEKFCQTILITVLQHTTTYTGLKLSVEHFLEYRRWLADSLRDSLYMVVIDWYLNILLGSFCRNALTSLYTKLPVVDTVL